MTFSTVQPVEGSGEFAHTGPGSTHSSPTLVQMRPSVTFHFHHNRAESHHRRFSVMNLWRIWIHYSIHVAKDIRWWIITFIIEDLSFLTKSFRVTELICLLWRHRKTSLMTLQATVAMTWQAYVAPTLLADDVACRHGWTRVEVVSATCCCRWLRCAHTTHLPFKCPCVVFPKQHLSSPPSAPTCCGRAQPHVVTSVDVC